MPIVIEAPMIRHQQGQLPFACMPKGRVADIVNESDGLDQILIETESTGDSSRYLSDFQSMSQTGSVMISLMIGKDLSLVFKSTECRAVNNAIPVVLIDRSVLVCFLRVLTSPAVTAEHGVGCKQALFQLLRPDSA